MRRTTADLSSVHGRFRRLLDAIHPPSVRSLRARFSAGARYEIVVGGCIVVGIAFLAIAAPLVAPADPVEIHRGARGASPLSEGFLLGADELGRDILSRVIWGSRLSLLMASIPTAIALLIGAALGLIAGYVAGVLDGIIMRALDVVLAFPTVLLALAIAAALGPSFTSVVIATAVVGIPAYARLMRASVLSVRSELYVESARSVGTPSHEIMLRHILPNVIAPVVVYGTLQTGRNVILASGLSFLGLGVQPPTPEWGEMLSAGRGLMFTHPHVAIIPGLAIFALTLGFNLLGDGLRDILDPRTGLH